METDNKKESNSTKLRQTKEKRTIIEQLKKTPIIQVACERSGVGRATFYRWREQDKKFDEDVKEALSEGEIFINELSETQVISLIKDKEWSAISFWLRNHHPKYTQRIEITTKQSQEELTPEQETIVREALRLAGASTIESSKEILTLTNQKHDKPNTNNGSTDSTTSAN